jgi:hypothetical protein
MNTEKINAAAEDFYPLLAKDEDSIIYNSFRRVAFTSGIDYAAANPDVIGCVKVEDVVRLLTALGMSCTDDELNRHILNLQKQQ